MDVQDLQLDFGCVLLLRLTFQPKKSAVYGYP